MMSSRGRSGRVIPLLHLIVWLMALAELPVFAQPPAPRAGRTVLRTTPYSLQERAELAHYLYQDRRVAVRLERLRQSIESRQFGPAVQAVQEILGDPQELLTPDAHLTRAVADSFFWQDALLISVRSEVIRLFADAPAELRNLYEQTWGVVAAQALDVAVQHGSEGLLSEVARRCFLTEAGFDATDLLATRLLDHGRPREAALLWEELFDLSFHQPRFSPESLIKAAGAEWLSADPDRARFFLAEAARRSRGPIISFKELSTRFRPDAGRPVASSREWNLPFGDESHNRTANGSMPWLQPVWTQSLQPETPLAAVDQWEQSRAARESDVLGVSIWPIIVQGQLVCREMDGIRAVDPRTGRLLWRYRFPHSLLAQIEQFRAAQYATSMDRLTELTWIANAMQGTLTSDGQRVFAVEFSSFSASPRRDGAVPVPQTNPLLPQNAQTEFQFSNRLICLPGEPSSEMEVQPLWTLDGAGSSPLSGHVFLGAPLPWGGILFVLTESRSSLDLNLVQIEADTGQVLRIQPLGLIERAMYDPSQTFRQSPMCLPALADGILVCPSEAGYLAGVEAASSALRWIVPNSSMNRGRFGTTVSRVQFGYAGMVDPPHIHNGRIVALPRISEHLHCQDLQTGQVHWRVLRQTEDLYVAALTDEIVAVVDTTGMHGLSMSDGREVWSARAGVPSGRGVARNGQYLLPLKSGGIATIDLTSGRMVSQAWVPWQADARYAESRQADGRDADSFAGFGLLPNAVPATRRPGNLLLHEDLVISTSATTLMAFRTAESLFEELRQAATEPDDSARELKLAMLEVTVGRNDESMARLRTIKPTTPQGDYSRWMLRELILKQLTDAGSEPGTARQSALLDELYRLSNTRLEKEQAQLERARAASAAGNWRDTLRHLNAARSEKSGLRSFLRFEHDDRSVVRATAWARQALADGFESSPEARRNAAAEIQSMLDDMQDSSIDELQRFVDLFARVDAGGPVRNQLAERLIRAGRLQDAELLLLQNQNHASVEVRMVAGLLLATLLDRAGYRWEAAHALSELERDVTNLNVSAVARNRLLSLKPPAPPASPAADAKSAWRSLLNRMDFSEGMRTILSDMQPLDWPVRVVSVTGHSAGSSNLAAGTAWNEGINRVQISDADRDRIEVDLKRMPSAIDEDWLLINRNLGVSLGRLRLPGQLSSSHPLVGHLLPLGTTSGMLGASLLEYSEGRPLWQRSFPPTQASLEKLESGPAWPSVCLFQSRLHLLALNPADGSVLWRRSGLERGSGVHVEREAGLFGNEEVLVVRHSDLSRYTVLATQTGRTLRTGELDLSTNFERRVLGHRLLHVTRSSDTQPQRIRLWNPATDRFDIDEPVAGKWNKAITPDQQWLALAMDGMLKLYQAPEYRLVAAIPLGDFWRPDITALQMFADRERVYLNLQRAGVQAAPGGVFRLPDSIHYLMTDGAILSDPVQEGWLLAIEPSAGRILWGREMTQKSFLRLNQTDLPFFVAASRIRMRDSGSLQGLDVELIDRRSGLTIGHEDRLLSDRFVYWKLDRNSGRLELHGERTRIDLDFSPARQGIRLQEQPL